MPLSPSDLQTWTLPSGATALGVRVSWLLLEPCIHQVLKQLDHHTLFRIQVVGLGDARGISRYIYSCMIRFCRADLLHWPRCAWGGEAFL